MKKYWILSMTLLALLISGPNAFAVPVKVGDAVTFQYGNSFGGGGGEFIATVNNSYSFGTFCLEKTENINFENKFYVASITDRAIKGGVPGPEGLTGIPLGDPISEQTAYLYYTYVKNNYSGWYDSNNNVTYVESEIQYAIWYLENEITSVSGNAKKLVELANTEVSTNQWKNNGRVRVMNMTTLPQNTDPSSKVAQDMLVVPEPATLLFLGLSMLGLGFASRRKYRNN